MQKAWELDEEGMQKAWELDEEGMQKAWELNDRYRHSRIRYGRKIQYYLRRIDMATAGSETSSQHYIYSLQGRMVTMRRDALNGSF